MIDNKKYHEIISLLHQLLSLANSDQLRSIAKAPNISPNIRDAILCLAKENESTRSLLSIDKQDATIATNASLSKQGKFKDKESLKEYLLDRLLNDNKKFPDKESLVSFCNLIGFSIQVKPKEGKRDLARKIRTRMASAPKETVDRVLGFLAADADKQTLGWYSLIRKS